MCRCHNGAFMVNLRIPTSSSYAEFGLCWLHWLPLRMGHLLKSLQFQITLDTCESCYNSLRNLGFQPALASAPLGKGGVTRLVLFPGWSLVLGQFPQPCYAVQSTLHSNHSEFALEPWVSLGGVHPIQQRSSLTTPSISPKGSASLGIFLDPLLRGIPFSEF